MRPQIFDDCDPNEFTLSEVTITEDEYKTLCDIAVKFVFDQVPECKMIINQIKHIFNNSLFVEDVYYDDIPFIVWIKSKNGPNRERFCEKTAENLKNTLINMTNGQIQVYVNSDSKQLDKILDSSNLKDLQIVKVSTVLNAKKFANAL
ncbi:hypothetical protein [Prevotella communis]|uniref:hypothetical protein n=1 Tax=Prevotella communis TaxID=2913614 RepID=UPI001EDADCC7|nr:hypothetical protein [Prevotella communis]UKK59718.1 hypothetical protein L6470_01510 [Prevotella communis]